MNFSFSQFSIIFNSENFIFLILDGFIFGCSIIDKLLRQINLSTKIIGEENNVSVIAIIR